MQHSPCPIEPDRSAARARGTAQRRRLDLRTARFGNVALERLSPRLLAVARLRRSNFHKSVWIKARAAVGMPELHFHDLRHTGGTLAATTGATPKGLMARLGQSSVRAAMIYQHATRDRDQAIAKALGTFVREVRDASEKPASGREQGRQGA